jgi:hypothetical protein
MATTYLQAVNSVLRRLRETEVATVSETNYSKLVGELVNDAKKQVEDAYEWNSLTTYFTVSTVASQYDYTVTGLGDRFRVVDFLNDSQDYAMINITAERMNRFTTFGTPQVSSPMYYTFSTVDSSTGDTKVSVYPQPDKVYTLILDAIVPQAELTSDSTIILAPATPIILNAYARALLERGEDNGLNSSEAWALYKSSLSDNIAIQAAHHTEYNEWVAN